MELTRGVSWVTGSRMLITQTFPLRTKLEFYSNISFSCVGPLSFYVEVLMLPPERLTTHVWHVYDMSVTRVTNRETVLMSSEVVNSNIKNIFWSIWSRFLNENIYHPPFSQSELSNSQLVSTQPISWQTWHGATWSKTHEIFKGTVRHFLYKFFSGFMFPSVGTLKSKLIKLTDTHQIFLINYLHS